MIDFKAEIDKYQDKLGLDFAPSLIEQGSTEWLKMRLGVFGASHANLLLMDKKRPAFPSDVNIIKGTKRGENYVTYNGKSFCGNKVDCEAFVRDLLPAEYPDTALTYFWQLIGQIITGRVPDEINARSLMWGKENEPFAREAFEMDNMTQVMEYPFIYKDESMGAGCSPDGIWIDSENTQRGLELKCPKDPGVFAKFACDVESVKKEWKAQCDFSMWVTGLELWDFAEFAPDAYGLSCLQMTTFERDEKVMRELDEKYAQFLEWRNSKLAAKDIKFGQQWSNI